MTAEGGWELVLTVPARRALTERLPEAVASAVIDFFTTALVREPRRVGKPLRAELAGVWSARRGTYRILYRPVEQRHEVIVLQVEHHRDIYRGPNEGDRQGDRHPPTANRIANRADSTL